MIQIQSLKRNAFTELDRGRLGARAVFRRERLFELLALDTYFEPTKRTVDEEGV